MATYPSAVISLPTHTDLTDTIFAADINTPNAEIVAVETGLLNGFQHDLIPLADDTRSLGSTSNRWLKVWSQDADIDGALTVASAAVTGNETVGGTLGVTGALTAGSASITGNETVGGTLTVNGVSSIFNNGLSVTGGGGGTYLTVTGGGLSVSGAATLGSAGVTGALTAGSFAMGGVSAGVAIAYSPTWGNAGTANTLGNGTVTGSYFQLGKQITVSITLTFGSTTVAGNGIWTFTVPFSAAFQSVGSGVATDSSASQAYLAGGYVNGGSIVPLSAPTGGFITAVAPYTWATSDTLNLTFVYFAA